MLQLQPQLKQLQQPRAKNFFALLALCLGFGLSFNLATQAQAQAENSASSGLPLIQPQQQTLAKAYNCVESKPAKEQEPLMEDAGYCAQIELQINLTQVEWLDKQLLHKFVPGDYPQEVSNKNLQASISQAAQEWLFERGKDIQEALDEEEPYFIAFEIKQNLEFLYQKYNLATFKEFNYQYSGGAHGIYNTKYHLFDLKQRKQLKLQDVLVPQGLNKLLESLEEKYRQQQPDLAATWFNTQQEMQQALLKGSFYFNQYGLELIYPPYELGPYSEGEIRLLLSYDQLPRFIKPEFLPANIF